MAHGPHPKKIKRRLQRKMVREGCRTFCNSSNLGLFREVGGRNFLFSPGNRGEHDPWMGACRSALEPASRPRGEIGATASHAHTHTNRHMCIRALRCTNIHAHTHIDTLSHTCTHDITHTHTHAMTTKHPQRPGFPRHASSSAPTSFVHAVPASPEHSSPSLLS